MRLDIDVLTNKVIGFSNSEQVYKDDIILNLDDTKEFRDKIMKGVLYYENGKLVEKESVDESEEKILLKELTELSIQDNDKNNSYVNLLLKGFSSTDALEKIKGYSLRIEEIKSELQKIKEKKEEQTKQFYIQKNKENDTLLNCKHYSSIVLICRDETKYLDEWLEYHIPLVDHIYIYDNDSIIPVMENVKNLSEEQQDKVTVIEWTGTFNNVQEDAYNHFLKTYGNDNRWVLFIDTDEFLEIKEEGISTNEFLKQYEDYSVIYGSLLEYNANGLETYENLPVRERFTTTTDIHDGVYHKDFMQPNRIDKMIRHYPFYNSKSNLLLKHEDNNKSLITIHHYYTKSWEEWNEKIERGSSDPTYLRGLYEFFEYNPDMEYLKTMSDKKQEYKN